MLIVRRDIKCCVLLVAVSPELIVIHVLDSLTSSVENKILMTLYDIRNVITAPREARLIRILNQGVTVKHRIS